MSQAETFVTQDELLRTSYGMIALTSVFAVTRVAIRVYRPKAWAMEDFFIVLAFILYLTLTTLYIIVTPILFRLSAFASGAAPPYPGLKDDSYKILKIFFATTELFWFTLWSVKFSLLALYKRLLVGLNSGYVKLWWAVVVFCVLVSVWVSLSQKVKLTCWIVAYRMHRFEYQILPQHARLVDARRMQYSTRYTRTDH
jgi:hypothetical protein